MEDALRRDLAAIKQAIEDGRRFAAGRGSYMIVWGGVIGLADVATYLTVRGRLNVDLGAMWPVSIALAWAATMFLMWREHRTWRVGSFAGRTMAMTWLACGVTLTILYLSTMLTGGFQPGWFLAIVAGTMAIGFFVSAQLCSYRWMGGVAVAWWLSEAACFAWRTDLEILLLSGATMLLMLALPGLLLLRRPAPAAA